MDENNNLLEEEINPDAWTQKELIKHLYREVNLINRKLDLLSDTISARYDHMNERISELERFKSSTNTIIKIMAGAIALLSGAIIGKLLDLM